MSRFVFVTSMTKTFGWFRTRSKNGVLPCWSTPRTGISPSRADSTACWKMAASVSLIPSSSIRIKSQDALSASSPCPKRLNRAVISAEGPSPGKNNRLSMPGLSSPPGASICTDRRPGWNVSVLTVRNPPRARDFPCKYFWITVVFPTCFSPVRKTWIRLFSSICARTGERERRCGEGSASVFLCPKSQTERRLGSRFQHTARTGRPANASQGSWP